MNWHNTKRLWVLVATILLGIGVCHIVKSVLEGVE